VSQRAIFMVVWSRRFPMLLRHSSPARCPRVPVAGCPSGRVSGGRVSGGGCPVGGCPVGGCPVSGWRVSGVPVPGVRSTSVRWLRVSCLTVPRRVGSWSESVRRTEPPRLGRAGFGVAARRVLERLGRLPRSGWRARSWPRPCWPGGGVEPRPGRRLWDARAAAAFMFDRLADQGQPVAREGGPSVGWGSR
jgi:hypothetical protein